MYGEYRYCTAKTTLGKSRLKARCLYIVWLVRVILCLQNKKKACVVQRCLRGIKLSIFDMITSNEVWPIWLSYGGEAR